MDTYPLYLNGRFVRTNETVKVIGPATGEPVGAVCAVGRDAVRQALTDAHAALPVWRGLTAKARGDYLLAVGAELQRRAWSLLGSCCTRLSTGSRRISCAMQEGREGIAWQSEKWDGWLRC